MKENKEEKKPIDVRIIITPVKISEYDTLYNDFQEAIKYFPTMNLTALARELIQKGLDYWFKKEIKKKD